jgi:preprotein translocase subunit SecE
LGGGSDRRERRKGGLPPSEKTREGMHEYWERVIRYLREVRTEMDKVSWPQKKEIIGSTLVVIVSVFLVSFFLGLVDLGLQKLVGLFLR